MARFQVIDPFSEKGLAPDAGPGAGEPARVPGGGTGRIADIDDLRAGKA